MSIRHLPTTVIPFMSTDGYASVPVIGICILALISTSLSMTTRNRYYLGLFDSELRTTRQYGYIRVNIVCYLRDTFVLNEST